MKYIQCVANAIVPNLFMTHQCKFQVYDICQLDTSDYGSDIKAYQNIAKFRRNKASEIQLLVLGQIFSLSFMLRKPHH